MEAEVGGLANLAAPPRPQAGPTLPRRASPRLARLTLALPASSFLRLSSSSMASAGPAAGRRQGERGRVGRPGSDGKTSASEGGAPRRAAPRPRKQPRGAPDAALRPEWDRSRRSLAERSWPHARRRRRRRHLGLHVNTRRGGGPMGGGGGAGARRSAQARSPAFPAGASAPCAAPRTRPSFPAVARRFLEAVPRCAPGGCAGRPELSATHRARKAKAPLTRTRPVQRGTLQISQRKD